MDRNPNTDGDRSGQLSPVLSSAACTLSPCAIDYRFQKRNSLGCPQTPFFPIFILLKTGKRKQMKYSKSHGQGMENGQLVQASTWKFDDNTVRQMS